MFTSGNLFRGWSFVGSLALALLLLMVLGALLAGCTTTLERGLAGASIAVGCA